MYTHTPSTSMNQTGLMMTIAATLSDLTKSLILCQGIPSYLSRVLNLEPITLAVLRESPAGDDSSLLLFCTSITIAPDASELLRRDMLNIARQPEEDLSGIESAIHPALDFTTASDEVQLKDFTRATRFTQRIDAEHRMILVLHQRDESQPLSSETYGKLEIISRQLARLLSCLVAWHTHPSTFGDEFKNITAREFEILEGLETDMGEKQLAGNMHLSSHTLHSHVKSIYRRLGVQSRLSAIKRIEASRFRWRIAHEGIRSHIPSVIQIIESPALAL